MRIEGVILYSNSKWGNLWLLDETDRIYVPLPEGFKVPPARTRARITGRTALVDGVPKIADLKVEALGPAELPPPVILMPLAIQGEAHLGHRVMLAGTVIEAVPEDDHLRMVVAFLRRFQIRVWVKHPDPASVTDIVGAQVEIAGCSSRRPESTDDHLSRIQIFVPDFADVTIYRRGPENPFDAPLVPLAKLREEFLNMRDPRLIRIRGTVGKTISENTFTLKAGSAETRVRLRKQVELQPGAMVEASGVIWRYGDEFVFDYAVAKPAMSVEQTSSEPESGLPVLRTVQAVRGLSQAEAIKKYPVEVLGSVTYYDREWRVLFVQDATGGIYVDAKRRAYNLKSGDTVRVRGVSDPGGFAPMIVANQVTARGAGKLPQPREVGFGRLMSGAEDSQWTVMEGTVESVERSQKNLQMRLRHSEGTFEAVLRGGGGLLKKHNWIGSQVRMTGVCGIKANAQRQVAGIYFHVPGMNLLEFVDMAPDDPFDVPLTAMNQLLRYDPSGEAVRKRVKISGVVTFAGSSGLSAIQGDTQGMLVPFPTNAIPAEGDRIEALGFPSPGDFAPTLIDAEWRTVETVGLPEPASIRGRQGLAQECDGKLIGLEAVVLEKDLEAEPPTLTLMSGGVVFHADMAAQVGRDLSAFAPQAVLSIVGVCSVQADRWHAPRTFRLLVPAGVELDLVKPAPWLTKERSRAAIQGGVVLALLAVAWIYALRSRVSRQTRRIEEEMNKRGQLSERYKELVSNADELIFTLDRNGVFTAVNPATERVFSDNGGGLLGVGIWPRLTEESRKTLRGGMQSLNPAEARVTVELQTDHPAERLTLEAGIRVQTKSGEPEEFQCIARDVSERRRLESQIRHMQKMESVGQLAAGAAHDYNNLMTVVLANAEFLRESGVLSGEDAENLEDIHDAAQRAAKVTDQLLAFSRRQVMTAESVRPDSLLEAISEMLQRLIGETIAFKLDVPEGLPNVRVDRGMIEQAVVNLVLNARDAMPDGGSLSVMARHESISQSEADQRLEALPGEHLRISVADTGCGIPKERLGHIFEPFYTTKETGKGTGLGLSTVFGIAKQHDGWVEVDSDEGVGTAFHLFLPTTVDEAVPETEPTSLWADKPTAGGETVLLVEDEAPVRQSMVKALERAGYRVLEASDGREAIEVWHGSEEPIDLLITDMVMPGGMSGRDIARELRRTHPGLLVIYCTGYSPDLTGLSNLTDRERLLPKPFESKMLFQLIRELLEKFREVPSSAV